MEDHDIIGYSRNGDGVNIPLLKSDSFVWSPPVAAADVVVEELRRARNKRQSSFHTFIFPKRMKHR